MDIRSPVEFQKLLFTVIVPLSVSFNPTKSSITNCDILFLIKECNITSLLINRHCE